MTTLLLIVLTLAVLYVAYLIDNFESHIKKIAESIISIAVDVEHLRIDLAGIESDLTRLTNVLAPKHVAPDYETE